MSSGKVEFTCKTLFTWSSDRTPTTAPAKIEKGKRFHLVPSGQGALPTPAGHLNQAWRAEAKVALSGPLPNTVSTRSVSTPRSRPPGTGAASPRRLPDHCSARVVVGGTLASAPASGPTRAEKADDLRPACRCRLTQRAVTLIPRGTPVASALRLSHPHTHREATESAATPGRGCLMASDTRTAQVLQEDPLSETTRCRRDLE